jgi:ParB-like chromosome segregation protein Spo0J
MPVKYIETTVIPRDDLTPFPGNAQRGDVEKIADSISEHGQYRSLIVQRTPDGRHIVLAGNQTMMALEALGDEGMRCEVYQCDDTTAAKINLLDNKSKDWGSYDNVALLELLEPFADDLSGTGFSDVELGDLLDSVNKQGPEIMEAGPTGARYSESDEEIAARQEHISSYEPRDDGPHTGATTELMLVLTLDQHKETTELVRQLRGEGNATAGEIVLEALRARVRDALAGADDGE